VIEDEIVLSGTRVRYRVRRSERARRLSMRVLPEIGLEVVLPRGAALHEAAAFVRREQRWVLNALARLPAEPAAADLADGTCTPFLDGSLRIRLTEAARTRIRRKDDTLHVALSSGVTVSQAVEAWYRAEARRVLRERAELHAAALGVTVGRVTIKDTRSRWGSCSSKGNLNFSWRLLLAPWAVMDYVAAHEVAHLLELNHSPRFWSLVESRCPGYREQRAWLRQHGRWLAGWPDLTPQPPLLRGEGESAERRSRQAPPLRVGEGVGG
jgi:predicted metal-dependent hydrolase